MSNSDLLRRAICQILSEAKTIDSMSFGSGTAARVSSIMPTDAGRKILTLARQGEFGPSLSSALTEESNLIEVFKLMCYALDFDPKQYKSLAASARGMLDPGQDELLRRMDRDKRAITGDVSSDYDQYDDAPAVRRYNKLDL